MGSSGLTLLIGAMVIAVLVLGGIGISQIRKGIIALRAAEAQEQEHIWHKQPNILLGINNFIFAILVCLVVLVSTETSASARDITLVGIGVIFLLSIVLVTRTALSALNTTKNLHNQQTNKRP